MYPWNRKFADTQLVELYNQGLPDTKIAKILNVNQSAVTLRRNKLGFPQISKTLWSEEETKKLIELYPHLQNSEITKLLGKSIKSIKDKAGRLHLRKSPKLISEIHRCNKPNGWKDDEIKKLRKLYPTTPNKDLARILNRSILGIASKAEKLGLYKNYMVTHERGKMGEGIAEKFFLSKGWQIIQRGNSITPYDFIVKINGETVALNVKNVHKQTVAIHKTNLLSLSKFKKSAIFVIASSENRKRFFILPIKEVN